MSLELLTAGFFYFIGLITGYLIGSNRILNRFIQYPQDHDVANTKIKRYNKHEAESQYKKPIDINEKKIVVDIKTTGMEKKYDNLGKVTQTEEDISASVNKLKNLRKD